MTKTKFWTPDKGDMTYLCYDCGNVFSKTITQEQLEANARKVCPQCKGRAYAFTAINNGRAIRELVKLVAMLKHRVERLEEEGKNDDRDTA